MNQYISNEELDTWLSNTTESDWVMFCKQLRRFEKRNLDKKSKKSLVKKIETLLTEKKYDMAYNHTLIYFTLTSPTDDEKYEILELLQPSRFDEIDYKTGLSLVTKIKNNISFLENNKLQQTYNSIESYFECYQTYLLEIKKLESIFLKSEIWLIGTCYSLIEEYFLGLRPLPTNGPKDISREKMATGLSLLLNTISSLVSLESKHFQINRKELIVAENALIKCVELAEFREMQPAIFRLNYSFEKIDDTTYSIKPNNILHEKSLKSGYIKNAMHLTKDALANNKNQSLYNLAKYFYDKFGDTLFHIIEEKGQSRLALGFMMSESNRATYLKNLADSLSIGKNTIFNEDLVEMEQICKDLFISKTELLDLELTDNFTMFDFLEIHRINTFIALVREHKLKDLKTNSLETYENSLISFASVDMFVSINEMMGIPEIKSKEYLKIYSWDFNSKDVTRDIQYYPMLTLDNARLIYPFALLSKSNFFRNTLFSQKIRPNDDGKIDRMSLYLKEMFKSISSDSDSDIKINFSDIKRQIDFATLIDDTLFIFECKNCLFPTSNYERRTLEDYLIKASQQLTDQISFFKNSNYQDYFFNKLQWKKPTNLKVKTCIVLGTRLYTGSEYRSHPIRYIHEINKYISEGTVSLSTSLKDTKKIQKKYWFNATFTKEDLIHYLSNECGFYTDHFASQFEASLNLKLGKITINYSDYPLRVEDYVAKINAE